MLSSKAQPVGQPNVAEDDLEQEGQEHHQQQRRRHMLGLAAQPGGDRERAAHLMALMRSSMPFGQSLAIAKSRYFFWAKARNAATSGV